MKILYVSPYPLLHFISSPLSTIVSFFVFSSSSTTITSIVYLMSSSHLCSTSLLPSPIPLKLIPLFCPSFYFCFPLINTVYSFLFFLSPTISLPPPVPCPY
uniref:Uncharacterized protein n=1 Tax=Cacopsylla melanoneura TaxID=428564 RepID=A0A8D9E9M0_9HEMI